MQLIKKNLSISPFRSCFFLLICLGLVASCKKQDNYLSSSASSGKQTKSETGTGAISLGKRIVDKELDEYLKTISVLSPAEQSSKIQAFIQRRSTFEANTLFKSDKRMATNSSEYASDEDISEIGGGTSSYNLWFEFNDDDYFGATHSVEWTVVANTFGLWSVRSMEQITVQLPTPPMVSNFVHNGSGMQAVVPLPFVSWDEDGYALSPNSFPANVCVAVSRVFGQVETPLANKSVDQYCAINLCL